MEIFFGERPVVFFIHFLNSLSLVESLEASSDNKFFKAKTTNQELNFLITTAAL